MASIASRSLFTSGQQYTVTGSDWDYDDINSMYYASERRPSASTYASTFHGGAGAGAAAEVQFHNDMAKAKAKANSMKKSTSPIGKGKPPRSPPTNKMQQQPKKSYSYGDYDNDTAILIGYDAADDTQTTQELSESTASPIGSSFVVPTPQSMALRGRSRSFGADSTTVHNVYMEDPHEVDVDEMALLLLSPTELSRIRNNNSHKRVATASSISASIVHHHPREICIPTVEPAAPHIPTQEELEAVYEELRRQNCPSQQELAQRYQTIQDAQEEEALRREFGPNVTIIRKSASRNASFPVNGAMSRSSSQALLANASPTRRSSGWFSCKPKEPEEQVIVVRRKSQQQRAIELGLHDEVASTYTGGGRSSMGGRFLLARRSRPGDEGILMAPTNGQQQHKNSNLLVVTTANGKVELVQVPKQRKSRNVVARFFKGAWKLLYFWKVRDGRLLVEQQDVESGEELAYYQQSSPSPQQRKSSPSRLALQQQQDYYATSPQQGMQQQQQFRRGSF